MEEGDRYVLQRNRWLLALVFTVVTFILVVAALESDDLNWLCWLGAVASGALTMRALFSASVIASDEGFCYHGLFRNIRRNWPEILRFEVWEVRGNQGGRLAVLVMIERDDDPLRGRSCQLNLLSWPARKPEEAERVRRWLNDHLDVYGRRDERR